MMTSHPSIVGPVESSKADKAAIARYQKARRVRDFQPKLICNQCGRQRYTLTEQDDRFLCEACIDAEPDLPVEEIYRLAAEIRAQRGADFVMDE